MQLTSPLIKAPHGFFTRDDNAEAVRKKLGAEHLITSKQIHSSVALHVSKEGVYEGDSLVVTEPKIAVAVNTADCVPILFYDAEVPVAAATHAGWRGARFGVIESTITLMESHGAKNIVAVVGPCIQQKSYEVGEEFVAHFMEESKENAAFFIPSKKKGHSMFDLPAYVTRKLKISGIERYVVMNEDTLTQPEKFCSYRLGTISGKKELGRQYSAIML